ncbi:hypothetical protein M405DRAFT_532504 [Rhizopogon salebrosus TDB-379]|nr:hypothetical protein M405DRAFT_532504 [Rhizopogon salebrosus TDB-379]
MQPDKPCVDILGLELIACFTIGTSVSLLKTIISSFPTSQSIYLPRAAHSMESPGRFCWNGGRMGGVCLLLSLVAHVSLACRVRSQSLGYTQVNNVV